MNPGSGSTPRMRLTDISRSFGGLVAVNGVHMELWRGEVLGLIGPNGSGKSTLMSLIAGQRRPTEGRIFLDGRDITGADAAARCRAGIACTFQMVHVPDTLSALDNVAVAAMYGRRRLAVDEARGRAAQLLETVGFVGDAQASAGQLTYFDQKRIELARALATDTEILLLDEWLAGLTPTELVDGIALIRALHRDRDLTIVVVEHVMAAIRELCDRAVVLSAGAIIAEGTVADCLSNPDVIAVYLGEDDDAA